VTESVTLRALHATVQVDGPAPDNVRRAWAPLGVPHEVPTARFTITPEADGWRLDDGPVGSDEELLGTLFDRIRVLARGTDDRVVVHAGAVRKGSTTLLLPGESGAGKSTLTAMLVRAGWGLLSDEMVGVDPGGVLTGCPLPLRLAPDACRRLGLNPPVTRAKSDTPLADLGGSAALRAAVTDVVFVRRGQGCSLEPVPRPQALVALADSTFAGVRPEDAMVALAAVSGSARCHVLASDDPDASLRAVTTAVG
jgi:hypothetical protein